MDANQTSSGYELKNELARYSLPAREGDGSFMLAWVNSICLLFLLIGIIGARRGVISIKALPPVRQVVPVVVLPVTLPPQKTAPKKEESPQPNQQPRVFVALPNSSNVHFSVPTVGAIVAPGMLASAPPLNPLQPQPSIATVGNTGMGGDRPQPPYPPLAMQSGEQGTIALMLTSDADGNIVSITIKKSSSYPYLDQATVEFIKNHWHLPVNVGSQLFQTSITYQLKF